jgi:hypothetical protein
MPGAGLAPFRAPALSISLIEHPICAGLSTLSVQGSRRASTLTHRPLRSCPVTVATSIACHPVA